MSVNKVILVGNLGRDPEVRNTQSGQSVCNLSLATTERYQGRDGQPREQTEWHNVVVWGKQAELCGQYLQKGRQVFVEGKITTREYEARDGSGKRYRTEVVAQRVQFLGGRPAAANTTDSSHVYADEFDGSRHGAAGGGASASDDLPPMPGDDEDIPF
jgi:single-strand DNA-binding protein